MDKQSFALWNVEWIYLSVAKLHRWSLEMYELFRATLYNDVIYLSMLGLKLIQTKFSIRGCCSTRYDITDILHPTENI